MANINQQTEIKLNDRLANVVQGNYLFEGSITAILDYPSGIKVDLMHSPDVMVSIAEGSA